MSATFIDQLSRVTSTSPKYWHLLQIDWQFSCYVSRRKNRRHIEPIPPIHLTFNKILDSPGKHLLMEFIKPSGRKISTFNKYVGANNNSIQAIINGSQRISPRMAARLASIFNTSPNYWLDIQSHFEAEQALKSKPILALREGRPKHSLKPPDGHTHPGRVLVEKFIKPSGIPMRDWQAILCTSKKVFDGIVKSRTEIPIEILFKFSQVFKTGIDYWIETQNRHFSWKASKMYSKEKLPKFKSDIHIPGVCPMNPIRMLIDNFLNPMGWTKRRFANYIGIDESIFEHIQKGNMGVSFELAIRIGEALEIDPKLWLWLQLEETITGNLSIAQTI